MAEYEVEQSMPAGAEAVFAVASDVTRLASWLSVRASADGPNRLHVEGELDGRAVDQTGLIDVRPEQLRVEWGSEANADYAGWLQIAHAGDDASSATLHLSFFGHQPENRTHHGDQVEDEMRAALTKLAELITS